MLSDAAIARAIRTLSGLSYQVVKTGEEVKAVTVSEIPSLLRDKGWRNVGRLNPTILAQSGLRVETAQYLQGSGRKARPCDVVVLEA